MMFSHRFVFLPMMVLIQSSDKSQVVGQPEPTASPTTTRVVSPPPSYSATSSLSPSYLASIKDMIPDSTTLFGCKNVVNTTNDDLYRNMTEQGNVTMSQNGAYFLPQSKAWWIIAESIITDPVNGAVLQIFDSKGALSWVYTPYPEFIGSDTFQIEQCIFDEMYIYEVECVSDCRSIDIVINVVMDELTPTNSPTSAPVSSTPVVAPVTVASKQIDESEESNTTEGNGNNRQFGYVALAILPILLFTWCICRYSIQCKLFDENDSNVGTMIGCIVDTTHDENRTVVSGLHTISSDQRPEQHSIRRDVVARRLTPIYDSDIEPSLYSGSGTTLSNTFASRNATDVLSECDQGALEQHDFHSIHDQQGIENNLNYTDDCQNGDLNETDDMKQIQPSLLATFPAVTGVMASEEPPQQAQPRQFTDQKVDDKLDTLNETTKSTTNSQDNCTHENIMDHNKEEIVEECTLGCNYSLPKTTRLGKTQGPSHHNERRNDSYDSTLPTKLSRGALLMIASDAEGV